ncbi:MAG: lipase family protein, partial [Solirubrobacterales bacterium]
MNSDSRRSLRQKALVIVIGGLLTMIALATAGPAAAITEPDADSFYDAPANFAAKSPGTILRQRSVKTRGLGIPLPVKTTQMLVRSTNAKGQPTTVVTTLMMPLTWSLGKRPLLSYQPAIDSLGDQCNPSYTLRTGLEKELPLMALGLLKGWAVVVTDYQGPNDAFAAGRMEGQGVLDGIRAAQKLSTAGLSRSKVGLWGYSGGGLASGWAAELAPSYAPELKIVGLAAGGMPSDLQAAGLQMDEGPFAGLFLAAAVGLSREYLELLAILNPRGMKLVEDMDDMCIVEEVAFGLFKKLRDHTTVPDPLHHPVVT